MSLTIYRLNEKNARKFGEIIEFGRGCEGSAEQRVK